MDVTDEVMDKIRELVYSIEIINRPGVAGLFYRQPCYSLTD